MYALCVKAFSVRDSRHAGLPAVYLLDEVWNFVNSPSTDINAMLEFINRRVAHKSPIVKAKVTPYALELCLGQAKVT